MGSGNNQPTGGQQGRTGLPPKQNKAVVGDINTTQNVAKQGLGAVQGISAPASVSPNSSGLNSQSAPNYWTGNPATYGQYPPGGGQNGGGFQGGTYGGVPTNPNFPGGGGGGSGTPSQNLPQGGGGPANVGNMGNQYTENVLSGQYLNPNSNPYERAAMNSADQPLIQNYETAIAPMNNAEMAMAGNFGGSAMMDNQANNEYQLANALGNTNANIANNAYNTGISQQEQAINQLPTVQQSQYFPAEAPLGYQNTANQGLMSLMNPYSYTQNNQYAPSDKFTPGQGVGAGLGLAGLALY